MASSRRLAIAVMIGASLAGGVAAAAPAAGVAPGGVGAPRHIDCRCRANGRTYELGARVCLSTPAGHRVAECRMEQNVTSWRFGREDCSVSASLVRPSDTAVPR